MNSEHYNLNTILVLCMLDRRGVLWTRYLSGKQKIRNMHCNTSSKYYDLVSFYIPVWWNKEIRALFFYYGHEYTFIRCPYWKVKIMMITRPSRVQIVYTHHLRYRLLQFYFGSKSGAVWYLYEFTLAIRWHILWTSSRRSFQMEEKSNYRVPE